MDAKRVVAVGKRTGRRIVVTIETPELCSCGAQMVRTLVDGVTSKQCSADAKCSTKAA